MSSTPGPNHAMKARSRSSLRKGHTAMPTARSTVITSVRRRIVCGARKVVDHDERRDQLGAEAIRLVARGGIDGLTFRAPASAADVSVNQIQH